MTATEAEILADMEREIEEAVATAVKRARLRLKEATEKPVTA